MDDKNFLDEYVISKDVFGRTIMRIHPYDRSSFVGRGDPFKHYYISVASLWPGTLGLDNERPEKEIFHGTSLSFCFYLFALRYKSGLVHSTHFRKTKFV